MNFKHDSTLTWPRSQIPPKLPSSRNANFSAITANLANIKQFIKENDSAKANKLLNIIYTFLNPDKTFVANKHIIDTISEEPPFESMNVAEATEETKKDIILDDDEVLDVKIPDDITQLPEPFWVQCLPHLCLITLLILYLAAGTFIYQWIDPAYGSKPFYSVLTMSFQVCFTIGWGNIPPLIGVSRLFTLVYAAIGVPLTFAVVSNFGRFIAKGYGVKRLFLSNMFSPKSQSEDRHLLALKDATALLLLHQFIGIILFNTWYGKVGVIEAWYFIWVTSAMIGFGDIIPDPQSLCQAITMCIYFAAGNLLMQAFLLSICYHIHRAYFVVFKLYLFKVQNFFQKRYGKNT